MKKTLLTLTIVGLLAAGTVTTLASCGGNGNNSSKVELSKIKATISNKEALKVEWHLGEANRQITLETDSAVNVSNLVNKGQILITSSDENVIKLIGTYLSPVSAGTATITVTTASGTDSVEITLLPRETAPEFIVPSSFGYALDYAQKDNEYVYIVTAEVDKVEDTTVGKMTVKAGSSSATINGLTASSSKLSWSKEAQAFAITDTNDYGTNDYTKDIKAGDKLTVAMIRSSESVTAVLLANNGSYVVNEVQTTDQVYDTEFNKNYIYQVTGKVTEVKNTTYGNLYIQTEGSTKDPLYVYGCTVTASTLVYKAPSWTFTNPKDYSSNDLTKGIAVGDTVTIVGCRCDYNGIVELNGVITNVQKAAA